MLALVAGGITASGAAGQDALAGRWRAQLDLAGGPLRFQMELNADGVPSGTLCNGAQCDPFSAVRTLPGDSVLLEIGDYAAVIRAHVSADSLVGFYRNVGNRGTAYDPLPCLTRHVARGAPAIGPHRKLGRDIHSRRPESPGSRVARHRARPGGHGHLQHR